MITIYLGHYVGKTAPGTECPNIFCGGIGPLQLGVVLVCLYFIILYCNYILLHFTFVFQNLSNILFDICRFYQTRTACLARAQIYTQWLTQWGRENSKIKLELKMEKTEILNTAKISHLMTRGTSWLCQILSF